MSEMYIILGMIVAFQAIGYFVAWRLEVSERRRREPRD